MPFTKQFSFIVNGPGSHLAADVDGGSIVLGSDNVLTHYDRGGTGEAVVGAPTYNYQGYGEVGVLSDGRYFTYIGNNANLNVQIFARDGTPATGVIDVQVGENGNFYSAGHVITPLATGGFGVFWDDYSRSPDVIPVTYPTSSGPQTYNAYAGIDVRSHFFNGSGVATGASAVIDNTLSAFDGVTASNRLYDQGIRDAVGLTGGGTATIYYDVLAGPHPDAFHTEQILSLTITAANGNSTTVQVDDGQFYEGGGGYDAGQSLSGYDYSNLIQLANGNLAVIWVENHVIQDGPNQYHTDGSDVKLRYFSASGVALSDVYTIHHYEPEQGNISRYFYAESLADSRIVVAWNEGIYGVNGSASNDAFLGTIDNGVLSDVTLLNAAPAVSGQNFQVYDLAVLADGTVEVEYRDATNSNRTTITALSVGTGITGSTLTGGGTLTGGALADLIVGEGGADTLTGNDGDDRIYGQGGDDSLFGNAGADLLAGNDGNDVLEGGAGGDELSGGLGVDTASYAGAAGGVTVNLLTGEATGSDATGDSFASIENLTGTSFNDRLTGDAGANTLRGGLGIDRLDGGDGNDTLVGGLGNDRLIGGAGVDTATYADVTQRVVVDLTVTVAQNTIGGGSDTLTGIENLIGTAFDDTLRGDGNANRIDGGAGNDVIEGGTGTDILIGGAGIDTISFAHSATGRVIDLRGTNGQWSGDGTYQVSEFENILGSAFNDVLIGGTGDNVIEGGLGNDQLYGEGGIDTVSYASAAAGVTVALASAGPQNTGGAGIDTLAGFENLLGSRFGDALTGDGANNTLDGGNGGDSLEGGGGNDLLLGGLGNDRADYTHAAAGVTVNLTITGAQDTIGAGIDTLSSIEWINGSAFDDTLTGDAGRNMLNGGAGNDLLNGGAGIDELLGGTGVDTVTYADATLRVVVDLSITDAQNTSGGGVDTLRGIENIIGTALNDLLTGSDAANRIDGGTGNDILYGGASADTLIGGDGNDWLYGQIGADMLTGGAGNDRFYFDTILNAVDTMTDFGNGSDRLYLDDAIFTALGAAGTLGANAFFSGSAAHDADDRILYDAATGWLSYDSDGSGSQGVIHFATIDPGLALAAGNFVVF